MIVVNPEKHPHVKVQLAQAFADWVLSPAGQADRRLQDRWRAAVLPEREALAPGNARSSPRAGGKGCLPRRRLAALDRCKGRLVAPSQRNVSFSRFVAASLGASRDLHPNDGTASHTAASLPGHGTRCSLRRYRTVWISDLHLGTPGCQAVALLDFLRRTECETLFLVGDIVDGWQLRRNWYWPQAHNDVVQKLLRKARKGTRVVFVPGNHDEFARRYLDHNFGGIEVVDDWLHVTADGKRLWVTHGDRFDGVIQCASGSPTSATTCTSSRCA